MSAEAHALDLGRQTLALLALDGEVIDVLVIDDAVDRDVERNLLRSGEVAVRLLLLDDRQGADPEGAQLRDAAGGADADGVLAEPAVGGDLDRGLDLVVVDDFQLRDAEAGRVEENFLGVGQPGAVEGENGVGPALRAARLRCRQATGEARSRSCTAENAESTEKNNNEERCLQVHRACSSIEC